jgi:hypothetical protein
LAVPGGCRGMRGFDGVGSGRLRWLDGGRQGAVRGGCVRYGRWCGHGGVGVGGVVSCEPVWSPSWCAGPLRGWCNSESVGSGGPLHADGVPSVPGGVPAGSWGACLVPAGGTAPCWRVTGRGSEFGCGAVTVPKEGASDVVCLDGIAAPRRWGGWALSRGARGCPNAGESLLVRMCLVRRRPCGCESRRCSCGCESGVWGLQRICGWSCNI